MQGLSRGQGFASRLGVVCLLSGASSAYSPQPDLRWAVKDAHRLQPARAAWHVFRSDLRVEWPHMSRERRCIVRIIGLGFLAGEAENSIVNDSLFMAQVTLQLLDRDSLRIGSLEPRLAVPCQRVARGHRSSEPCSAAVTIASG